MALTARQLRKIWREFFVERGHTEVRSASLIPTHPSAPLFNNSGMMQFVPYFLREEQPPYLRAESIQKCVRLSGKHNDIDELGKTRRHLSFFEMLGNFSFGDYFKEDAIRWAWELVTSAGFDGDRIWITVHDSDDEAEAIWRDTVGIPAERIQRLDKENFWEMGPTGPCGPCSEIHYDNGPEWGEEGGPKFGGGDRYIEFWNLVFPQYFRQPDGSLTDLPHKGIDTGAGLERWLMLLQDVPTVFDTDVVRPLIDTVSSVSGVGYRSGDDRSDVALRVIADHARSMSFLVSDGVIPSNEDRGYVLRSVIRRAVTRGQQLGIDRPFLSGLVGGVVELMGDDYPELRSNADLVASTIEREEHAFRKTLATGSALLEAELAKGAVTGDVAFKLHDTYGFPIEITSEIAEERGVVLDRAGFDDEMTKQRERSKAGRPEAALDDADLGRYRSIVEQHGLTDFTGREEYESKARVVAVMPGRDEGTVEIFLDRTPFYAESGGQVGDTGTITGDGGRAEVIDTTYAVPGLNRHVARIVDGEISEGDEVVAAIDGERRDAIRRNHTGTHVLHWALREVLGAHVKQQGSLVSPEYLRFDFSHYEPVTAEELQRVEDLANREILANDPVRHYETSKEHAEQLGAIAFFGDKYGETVRVLEAGAHSIELCGGTHVRRTGDIGPVKIASEGSIGANMRRIFATTGTGTLERVRREEEVLKGAAQLLDVPPENLVEGVERRLEEIRRLRDEIKSLRRQSAGAQGAELADTAVDGVVVARVDGTTRDELRDLAVAVRDRPGVRAVVLGGAPEGGGAALVSAVRPDSGLSAPELIADAARTVKGGGGKSGDLVMAGGKDPERLDEALDLVRTAAGIA